MKIILIVFLTTFNLVFAQSEYDMYYDTDTLDVNSITAYVSNLGDLDQYRNYDFIGISWEKMNYYRKFIYDQGLWVIGKINNFPHLAISKWGSYYSIGPIINGEAARKIHPEDSLKYRVYKISEETTINDKDYNEWPADWGAPVDDEGNPVLYADQTLFTVYNSLDQNYYRRNWWNENRDTLPPMPIEVQQLTYAYSVPPPNLLDDVIFFEYTIINKGAVTIDSTFIGFWTDIDLLWACNPMAIDTLKQLGYCYSCEEYVIIPGTNDIVVSPAAGYLLKYGPLVKSQGNTAVFKGRLKTGYRNLDMSSFKPISDDNSFDSLYGNIHTLEGAWNAARGLNIYGGVVIDTITNVPTNFPLYGNPVDSTGWIYDRGNTGGGAGFLFFSGPFNMAPNDTQWVMIALIAAKGSTMNESINKLRIRAQIIQNISYDDLVKRKSLRELKDNSLFIPEYYHLSQNYPNPFNPVTTIKYSLPVGSLVTLKVYDLLGNEISTLVNKEQEAGEYSVEFSAIGGSAFGGNAWNLASGIYFYTISARAFTRTKKMILLR